LDDGELNPTYVLEENHLTASR